MVFDSVPYRRLLLQRTGVALVVYLEDSGWWCTSLSLRRWNSLRIMWGPLLVYFLYLLLPRGQSRQGAARALDRFSVFRLAFEPETSPVSSFIVCHYFGFHLSSISLGLGFFQLKNFSFGAWIVLGLVLFFRRLRISFSVASSSAPVDFGIPYDALLSWASRASKLLPLDKVQLLRS